MKEEQMNPEINERRLTRLMSEMVKIESINPDLVAGGSGEQKVAEFTANFLKDNGLEASIQQIAPGRCNVIGVLKGTGGGKNLLIDAHLDTVSVEGMDEPFSGRVEDGKLFGRGSADDKGGVAAGVEALIALKESGICLKGDVIVSGVAGEEYASEGSEALIKKYQGTVQGCIIGEPSRMSQGLYLSIGVGSGGFVWVEFETRGNRTHGSLFRIGVDAIDHMSVILQSISQLKQRLIHQKPYVNPLADHGAELNPSLHNSLIKGGFDLATYPDLCTLSIERRTVYGETFAQVREEIDQIMRSAKETIPNFNGSARVVFEREPWEAQKSQLLSTIEEEAAKELGKAPLHYAVAGWDDGAIASNAGIPTVVFGPSGNNWHGLGEYVDIASLHKCARVMANSAIRFCK
jgi:acetylornithine deacetylase